jgi:hypothetical protein
MMPVFHRVRDVVPSSLATESNRMPPKTLAERNDHWIHELARRFIETVRYARIKMGDL